MPILNISKLWVIKDCFFGAVINENLNDEIIVTVIATGFEDNKEPLYHSYQASNNTAKVEPPKETIEQATSRETTRQTIPSFATNSVIDDSDDDDDDDIIPSFLRKRGSF